MLGSAASRNEGRTADDNQKSPVVQKCLRIFEYI